MPRASTSQSNHMTWCLSLELKKPATWGLPWRLTYNVAPIPCSLTEASGTVNNWSSGVNKCIVELEERTCWALAKAVLRVSDQGIASCETFPATAGARWIAQAGITGPRTLYVPRNVHRPRTVRGGSHDARVAMQCGLAFSVPWDHTHPNMTVDLGAMTVLEGDRRMLQAARAARARLQLMINYSRVLPPTYNSSAILVTMPSCKLSLGMRRISSSRAVSNPGIPIAALVYPRVPLKCKHTVVFHWLFVEGDLIKCLGEISFHKILPTCNGSQCTVNVTKKGRLGLWITTYIGKWRH